MHLIFLEFPHIVCRWMNMKSSRIYYNTDTEFQKGNDASNGYTEQ
jgi:hypothetical protein